MSSSEANQPEVQRLQDTITTLRDEVARSQGVIYSLKDENYDLKAARRSSKAAEELDLVKRSLSEMHNEFDESRAHIKDLTAALRDKDEVIEKLQSDNRILDAAVLSAARKDWASVKPYLDDRFLSQLRTTKAANKELSDQIAELKTTVRDDVAGDSEVIRPLSNEHKALKEENEAMKARIVSFTDSLIDATEGTFNLVNNTYRSLTSEDRDVWEGAGAPRGLFRTDSELTKKPEVKPQPGSPRQNTSLAERQPWNAAPIGIPGENPFLANLNTEKAQSEASQSNPTTVSSVDARRQELREEYEIKKQAYKKQLADKQAAEEKAAAEAEKVAVAKKAAAAKDADPVLKALKAEAERQKVKDAVAKHTRAAEQEAAAKESRKSKGLKDDEEANAPGEIEDSKKLGLEKETSPVMVAGHNLTKRRDAAQASEVQQASDGKEVLPSWAFSKGQVRYLASIPLRFGPDPSQSSWSTTLPERHDSADEKSNKRPAKILDHIFGQHYGTRTVDWATAEDDDKEIEQHDPSVQKSSGSQKDISEPTQKHKPSAQQELSVPPTGQHNTRQSYADESGEALKQENVGADAAAQNSGESLQPELNTVDNSQALAAIVSSRAPASDEESSGDYP